MIADWHFARQTPGGTVFNPLGGEHFNQGAVGDSDWEAGESLVRESIQNSLDAASGSGPVDVRFTISPHNGMSAATAKLWFGSLWPHVRARECKFGNQPASPMAGGFLVVEDFGTKGLEGDTARWQMPREEDPGVHDFFHFFRAEGLSGKGEGRGGSWGVGKSVFSRCSSINTFLAVSVRVSDRRIVTIGKSLLWHHYIGKDEYRAIGQFGVRAEAESDLIVPTDEADALKRLAADFKLARPLGLLAGEEPEPGLSIIVPYAEPEITAKTVLSIVVREYFQPILAGRLGVTVVGEGLPRGRTSIRLDSASILEEAEALSKPELVRLLRLADWARAKGEEESVNLIEPSRTDAPQWSEGLFPPQDPMYAQLSERFGKGEPIALRVPLRVHPIGGKPADAAFNVYLQRDMDGDGYRPLFVRAGLVVPNARERSLRGHSLFAIVDIADGPLAAMLRLAEPPAHTSWSHETQNFKNRYEFGRQTIGFVTGAPKFIADLLSSAHTERDVLALADFFPEPDDDGRDSQTGKGKKKGKDTNTDARPPQPRPKPFRIAETPGGFRVTRDNADKTALPARLVIRVAYDTSRGNALNKYHPADFRLSTMKPRLEDADTVECEENTLVVSPRGDDFSVEVGGFDANRDLFVRVAVGDADDAPAGGEA